MAPGAIVANRQQAAHKGRNHREDSGSQAGNEEIGDMETVEQLVEEEQDPGGEDERDEREEGRIEPDGVAKEQWQDRCADAGGDNDHDECFPPVADGDAIEGTGKEKEDCRLGETR